MSIVNANQRHPFAPRVNGVECREMQYPEHKYCGQPFDAAIHTGARPTPPGLEFPYPPCSLCGEDTYHDGDGFRCDPCGASWSSSGCDGLYDEPEVPACAATYRPHDRPDLGSEFERIRNFVNRCNLPADHDGKHRDDDGIRFEVKP